MELLLRFLLNSIKDGSERSGTYFPATFGGELILIGAKETNPWETKLDPNSKRASRNKKNKIKKKGTKENGKSASLRD